MGVCCMMRGGRTVATTLGFLKGPRAVKAAARFQNPAENQCQLCGKARQLTRSGLTSSSGPNSSAELRACQVLSIAQHARSTKLGFFPMAHTTIPEPRPSQADGCPFCQIAERYSPFNPLEPRSPQPSAPTALPREQPESFVVLSTRLLVAFLDIAPLSRGHLLLCPRRHCEKLTAVGAGEARELGYWLRVLSAALVRATGVGDWNIVQNNGAAAAQVVPHAHFHIIPRPEIREQGRWSERFTMFGRGSRTELDDNEAVELAAQIQDAVAYVLKEEEVQQQQQQQTGESKAKL